MMIFNSFTVTNYTILAQGPKENRFFARKVLESIGKSSLTQTSGHLDHLALLYKHQYSFRRGRSTVQAVGHLNNSVLDTMDGEKVTGMLFLDLQGD